MGGWVGGYIYIYIYLYKTMTYLYIDVELYIFSYIYIHIYTYIYTYIHIYIYMYVYIYICMYKTMTYSKMYCSSYPVVLGAIFLVLSMRRLSNLMTFESLRRRRIFFLPFILRIL